MIKRNKLMIKKYKKSGVCSTLSDLSDVHDLFPWIPRGELRTCWASAIGCALVAKSCIKRKELRTRKRKHEKDK